MAESTQVNGQESWTIHAADGCTSAGFIPAFGGIGHSLTLPFQGAPRETLFLHDFFWNETYTKTRGGWPFLFPVCGRLERDGRDGVYLYRDRLCTLPPHGFSLRKPWTVEKSDRPDALTMTLAADDATRQAYPFSFRLRMTYRVAPGELRAELSVQNTGTEPMPYYAGYHPYFLTPPQGGGKEGCRISVQARRQWTYNERLTDVRGTAKAPVFPASVLEPCVNETLNEVLERTVTRLDFPDGFGLEVAVSEESERGLFPFVQLYTIPERPFFCIEPWMGHPNALNAITGSRWLPPGACDQSVLRVGVRPS